MFRKIMIRWKNIPHKKNEGLKFEAIQFTYSWSTISSLTHTII